MSDAPELDSIVREFLVESHENLDQADQEFVELERDPGNREILARIFRMVHTIKGSCGFLGFPKLQALAHSGENLLGKLREGALQLDEAMTTTLLQMVDAVRTTLGTIEAEGAEGDATHEELIAALDAHVAGRAPAPGSTSMPGSTAAAPTEEPYDRVGAFVSGCKDVLQRMDRCFDDLDRDPADHGALDALRSALAGAQEGCRVAGLPRLGALVDRAGDVVEHIRDGSLEAAETTTDTLLDVAATLGEAVADAEAEGQAADRDRPELDAALDSLVGTPLAPAGPKTPGAPGPVSRTEAAIQRASITEQNIRVDVNLLDKLMNQVGELVLARNRMLRHVSDRADETLGIISQRLSQITTELQESVMLTRLQPIETVWNKLPRMVRDLSVELGKRVRLEMQGEETELDRTLNEAIRAPMTHLVRNAVDHGLERESERIAAGKVAEGRLLLRAYHEGGQVNIEIEDDGRGIDVARVEARALERGLITAEQAAAMSEREKLNLIFLPGFSTATAVTNISGRGVGMDVVRSSIDRINGLIDIQSVAGQGTRIKLKIPLTLAIIPALIARCGGERYAIPQVNLVAVVHVSDDPAEAAIERLHNVFVYRWRGRLLPIVFLREALELQGDPTADAQGKIVVLQSEDRLFGLVVDDVLDTEEIVVKPLGRQLSRIPVFAGATIMGDGRAALILDVLGLAQTSAVVSGENELEAPAAAEAAAASLGELRTVLLVRVGEDRAAIPVTSAVRLERFPRTDIELSGRRPIVQYRGSVLPLRSADASTDAQSLLEGTSDSINVVVHSEGGHSVGYIVDELLDIVEERFVVEGHVGSGRGVLGTALIQNKVARVLDLTLSAEAEA
jgi:two-component system chemotaxis sensor kinase CheA